MADIVTQHNIAALGYVKRLTAQVAYTAGGGTSTTTGAGIDRMGFGSGALPRSADMALIWEATLATGKTLSVNYAVQDSADNSTFADYQTGTTTVVGTGSTAASALVGEFNIPVDLNSARRYVRLNLTVALSATQTDTAVARGVGFFGGSDRLPSLNG